MNYSRNGKRTIHFVKVADNGIIEISGTKTVLLTRAAIKDAKSGEVSIVETDTGPPVEFPDGVREVSAEEMQELMESSELALAELEDADNGNGKG